MKSVLQINIFKMTILQQKCVVYFVCMMCVISGVVMVVESNNGFKRCSDQRKKNIQEGWSAADAADANSKCQREPYAVMGCGIVILLFGIMIGMYGKWKLRGYSDEPSSVTHRSPPPRIIVTLPPPPPVRTVLVQAA
jgi:hypothetical protein